MKYRQWKKNYKKQHGVNPPIAIDKKKQQKIARRAYGGMGNMSIIETASRVAAEFTEAVAEAMRWLGKGFDAAGTACRKIADDIQPLKIKGRIFDWEVRKYGDCHFAVHEINALDGSIEIKVITNSRKAAEKIVEIMEIDQQEYIGQMESKRILQGQSRCRLT